ARQEPRPPTNLVMGWLLGQIAHFLWCKCPIAFSLFERQNCQRKICQIGGGEEFGFREPTRCPFGITARYREIQSTGGQRTTVAA
ncbi:hypothetical protein, partial [Fervidibacter sacchari]